MHAAGQLFRAAINRGEQQKLFPSAKKLLRMHKLEHGSRFSAALYVLREVFGGRKGVAGHGKLGACDIVAGAQQPVHAARLWLLEKSRCSSEGGEMGLAHSLWLCQAETIGCRALIVVFGRGGDSQDRRGRGRGGTDQRPGGQSPADLLCLAHLKTSLDVGQSVWAVGMVCRWGQCTSWGAACFILQPKHPACMRQHGRGEGGPGKCLSSNLGAVYL